MHSADHVVVGDEDVVEEDLAEAGITAELRDRPDGDAVGLQVEHEIGEPTVALSLGIGTEQPESSLAERRSRTPDLLAVE